MPKTLLQKLSESPLFSGGSNTPDESESEPTELRRRYLLAKERRRLSDEQPADSTGGGLKQRKYDPETDSAEPASHPNQPRQPPKSMYESPLHQRLIEDFLKNRRLMGEPSLKQVIDRSGRVTV